MANQLNVYREGIVISTFDIDGGTIFSEKLQGARTITCPVAAENALPLQDGDYIIHDGEVYIINTLPDFLKDGGKLQKEYNITFEAEFYLLLDTFILNDQGHADFPLYGSAVDHLNVIFANANRNDTGWTVGEVAATAGEVINYNWTYVRTALDEIAAKFKLEWSFVGRTIRMVSQIGTDTGLTFEVGRAKGLHQISRTQDSGKSVVTRVFGVGGSRNIDSTYRAGVEPNLTFEGRYVETAGVTAGTERVREGKYENDQIYPRFNGNITSVVVNRDGANLITDVVITDTAIDFDINAHLQEGVTAKVSFRTGALTGSEFEIESYNAATKAIVLIPTSDTNGYVLPNDLNLPLVGDKFTLLDIRMPAAYVTAAELELRNASLQYLDDNDKSRLLFGVKPDPKFLRENNIVLKVGDRATAVESEVDLNEILRFTEISYPLVDTFDVTAAIGNEIAYNRVVKLFAEVLQTQRDVQVVDRRSAELAKRGVKDLRAFEASVFDTDGMFDSDKFNVGVLTAILGIFGAKSQNFKLNGVYITDNYGADNTKVFISGGELIHFEISNEPGGNIWTIGSLLANVPTTSALYYVYARCSRTSQAGSWVVSTAQIKAEDEAGFYHFLTGVVYPVIDGWRNSDFTNGIADINGNRLKIGKIVSRDGLTGFDLDASTIFGAITFASGSSGYNNIADKPDLSIYATQDFVDAIKDELQGQIDGAITTWFYPYVPTLSNVPASGWATDEEKNAQLGDLFYDTATGYAYRFQVSGGVYSWAQISDTDITLALQKAQQAQDTADGKRRVFTVTPYTPYDDGDLWSQGTGGDLMRCNVARASGAYVASDWGLASKYTDDTAVDNLVIGGRNYVLGSKFSDGLSGWTINGGTVTAEVIDGKTCVKIISNASGNGIYSFSRLTVPIESGVYYSVSFDIKGIYYDSLNLIVGLSASVPNIISVPNSSEWTRVSYSRLSTSGGVDAIVIYGAGGDQQFYITNLKIELGNKATDWTPAPEDVKAEADAAAAAAQAAAINYADAKAYAAGKILYRDAEFKDGVNGILTYNNAQNGNVIIDRLPRSSFGEGTQLALPTTSPYGVRIRNTGEASPGHGGFFFGTQSRANAKFVTRIIAYIPVGRTINFANNSLGDGATVHWATSQEGTGAWTEYIHVTKCGVSGSFSSSEFFWINGGAPGFEWYIASATVYDVTDSEVDYLKDATAKANAAQAAAIAQAAATAETIAQSKADIAQAAAISAAATDATTKANAAKAAAEAASNTFAQTAANNAASDAEVAAAADASNKATAAYNDAVAAAAQAQANLTASLGALAYENVVELSKLGSTVIQGGMIVTNLLNADYIKANIVNADYVNTLALNASAITTGLLSADRIDAANFYAQKLAAVAGTIGEWTISAGSIVSGSYGGRLTSDVAYVDGGKTMASIGTIIDALSPGSKYTASKFLNTSIRGQSGNINVGIYAEASGASTQNVAIHAYCPTANNGSALYVDGNILQIAGGISSGGSLSISSGVVSFTNMPTMSAISSGGAVQYLKIVVTGVNTGRIGRDVS